MAEVVVIMPVEMVKLLLLLITSCPFQAPPV